MCWDLVCIVHLVSCSLCLLVSSVNLMKLLVIIVSNLSSLPPFFPWSSYFVYHMPSADLPKSLNILFVVGFSPPYFSLLFDFLRSPQGQKCFPQPFHSTNKTFQGVLPFCYRASDVCYLFLISGIFHPSVHSAVLFFLIPKALSMRITVILNPAVYDFNVCSLSF